MNVRKRGLALLMCICMIFTLLPFSALAADSDVVYGQYVNGKWQQDTGATASQTYTDETTGANIEYSKEAKATSTPNVYDVTLTIKNTTTKVSAGASAVVLVIDTSLSMDSDSRIANAKQAAKNFAESYGATGGERYLAVVKFAGSASALNFGTESAPVNWLNVSNSANLSKVQTAIGNMETSKSTNLSGGLSSAKSLFNDSTVSGITNFKYAVVLTDGEPNVSDVPNVRDGYEAAAQRATELKNTGCEVYTVGVSLNNKAETFLKNQVASSADKAYTTDNAADLNNIFSEIFKEIDKGITSGFTVSDPMGDYAELRNTTLTDCVIADNGFTWTPKNGTSVTNSDGSTTTTYTLTYQVKLDVDSIPANGTYPLNGVTTLTFGGTTLNFNVPGVKGEVPRYTVTYNKGANGSLENQDDNGNVVHNDVKKGTATPVAPAVTPDEGYWFTGWDKEIAKTVTADVTYTAQYAAKKVLTVTAKSAEVTYNGETQSVSGFEQLVFDGYTVSSLTASASGTDKGTYTTTITGTAKVTDKAGTDVTEQFTVNTVSGELKINPATVTLTGESGKKVYNGELQKLTGITVKGLIDGHSYSGRTYSAMGLGAGEYDGAFSGTLVIEDAKGNDVTANYGVHENPGTLTITTNDAEVVVTIGGKTGEMTYDGESHKVMGYANVTISDPTNTYTYNDFDLKDGFNNEVSGKDAGTYMMGLSAASFENLNKNFTNVKFVVTDGSLTINPASVTVKANDAEKVYGEADPKFTATVSGLIGDDTVTYTIDREVGENVGTYTITPTGAAEQGNYVVEYQTGTLTITKAGTLTVAGTDYKGVYDGKAHGESATASVTEGTTISYKVGEGEWTSEAPTITNVGSITVSVKAENPNYETATAEYTLTVTPASVTVKANDAEKVYGEADPKFTATVSGLIGDDTVTYTIDREVGENVGTYTITPTGAAEQGNYVVEYQTGTLTITKAGTLTVAGTDYKGVYDGKAHGESATASVTEGTTISYKVGEGEWTSEAPTITNVGSITVSVKAENPNYETATAEYTLTVTPKAVTFTGESDSKEYNGEEQELTGITVEGLLEGHEYSGLSYSAKGKDVGEYTGEFSGDVVIKDAEGNDVTKNYAVTKTPSTLTITKIQAEVTVVINGATDTVYYNGKEQSVTGYDWTSEAQFADKITVTLNEEGKDTAKGTRPDTYYMGLTEDDFTVKSDVYANIIVVVNDGWLKINRRPVGPTPEKITVTITGNTDSKVYDGTEQNVNGYTWVSSDPSYTEKDFEFSGKADANGTYVGSYDMGITADQFKNINSRYTVEFIVETDGELKITPKPLTITAGSKEGVAPVTCDEWTATETAKGDTIVSVTITGIQPVPGESPNKASDAVIKNEAGVDVTNNYDITYVDGVLRAIEVLNKEEHFNYVIGYTDGTIRPGNNISRAEIATIFFRLLKDDVREKYMTTDCDFSDVASGAWCRRAIATLTNIGIIHGYTDGTFRPNAQITRAELATIIARFANLDVNTKTFSDITGHWAQKSIELAAGNGWINGYTDGTFRPNNKITRAETFAMINRVLDRMTKSVDDLLPQSDMNMWLDNMDESAWYYRDVQEATNYHKCDRVGDSIYEKWTAKIADIDWAVYQI